jgi:hypothetical protein
MNKKAEIINNVIDAETKKHPCDSTCKYWCDAFSHRSRACSLSDVFSVEIGLLCPTYEQKEQGI